MSAGEARLYGVPGAEWLHDDPAAVYEADIEPHYEPMPELRLEIEEYDTYPTRHHFPSVDGLLVWIVEWVADNGEVTEGFDEGMRPLDADPEVRAAADALLDLMASKVGFLMAKDHLRSLWVTWDNEGEPLLDGEPMYRPASAAPEGENQ